MPQVDCPRRVEGPFTYNEPFVYLNKPDDGTCDYCGSLLPDAFMARLEAGDVKLDPTDKSYKVYVHNDGGDNFKQSYRTDKPAKPGEITKDPMDQTHWVWETREQEDMCKFYFQHLSPEQQARFVELLNEKKLKLNYPGHFYSRPFFIAAQTS